MFVSIIQPVYNAEKYLEETIISVLQQTHVDFEYILIDDGSIDLSYSLILKYAKIDNRIRILKHEVNKGYIAALNNGIRNSRFEYIFRIDSDDLISSTTLTNRINAYISNPNCVLVSGIPTLFSNSKTENILLKYFPTNLNTTNWVLQWGNPITHSSSFFKKEHLIKTQKFHPKLF
jgi:glycosyltransferase involved in cell wall biosynthesis